MELQGIELKDGEPHTVTVQMSVEEAAWIAVRAGAATDDRTDASETVYDCLAGDLFNRFWPDGVDGYLRAEPSE